ncbi:hypothetical protein EYR38_001972 [Pleurotus pulmonarius]|nr:hypothetical protein EYR38_001972 [Pleurotus pulmonarius]
MTQAFHDTMDDEFGRKRFWADVREEWLSRWDLTDRQNRRLSSYFRDAMRSRGAIPPRVRQPKKANKAARPPLAATTRHQASQAEEPESTQDSSEAVEEFQSSTPLFSRSPTAGPSRVPRPPTPPTLASHSPTPGPSRVPRPPTPSTLASHSPTPGPSRVPRPLTPPTLAKSPSVRSSPAPLKHAPGAVTVLPPSSIWTKEVSKCLAFQLELPGIEHPEDVELVIQGQLLAVYARSDTVAYKWTTNVGGPVKADHVHCGLEDGVIRVLVKVMCLENITDERQVFSVDDILPW